MAVVEEGAFQGALWPLEVEGDLPVEVLHEVVVVEVVQGAPWALEVGSDLPMVVVVVEAEVHSTLMVEVVVVQGSEVGLEVGLHGVLVVL